MFTKNRCREKIDNYTSENLHIDTNEKIFINKNTYHTG